MKKAQIVKTETIEPPASCPALRASGRRFELAHVLCLCGYTNKWILEAFSQTGIARCAACKRIITYAEIVAERKAQV